MGRGDRNVLLLGLLVIALVVGYRFLLLSPVLGHLGQSAEVRNAKQAQLANLRQEVARLEAVQRNAPEAERQQLELFKRVPAQPEILTLVVQIEEVADAAGVIQLSIQPGTPGPPPGGGDYSAVTITMSFEGTYEQLQLFLENTRNLARLVTINMLAYEEARHEGTALEQIEQTLQVEIEAEVYFQPSVEPSVVPAGPAPTAPALPENTTPEETKNAP